MPECMNEKIYINENLFFNIETVEQWKLITN